jgi:rod shape-determining protein MreB
LLIADAGAQVTEVAVLAEGRVTAARRTDVGTSDSIQPAAVDPVARTIADSVSRLHQDLCAGPRLHRHVEAFLGTALLLFGGGAAQPGLAARTARALGRTVWSATRPQIAAVHGAGLVALAALRHTGVITG